MQKIREATVKIPKPITTKVGLLIAFFIGVLINLFGVSGIRFMTEMC